MEFPPLLQTARLFIRAPDPDAAAVINDAIRESHDSLRAWMPWAEHVPSLAETAARLRQAAAAFSAGSDLGLYFWNRHNGTFVGAGGVHARLADTSRREVGYWLRTSARGNGLATEAVRTIARQAILSLGLAAVEIHSSSRNLASQRVALRAGFTLATVRDDGRVDRDGVASLTHVYELRPEDA
jgi:RimJ/RimL family protein N-acetyltransferase